MGADMLVTALVIDAGRLPDFDAARLAVDSIRSSDIEIPDEFWDDADSDVGLEAIRYQLRDSLGELEAAFQQSRELAWFEVRGATVYLTGGLSNGDAPTELFETFCRLYAVPAVLEAAGFEVTP